MSLIGDWRSCDYNTWIEIGWALYNLTDGCKEGLEIWMKFSQEMPRTNIVKLHAYLNGKR